MVERRSRRSLLLGLVIVLLLAGVAASLLVGSRGLAPDRVWELLWHPDGSLESAVVRGQRLPRTVLGLVVVLVPMLVPPGNFHLGPSRSPKHCQISRELSRKQKSKTLPNFQ